MDILPDWLIEFIIKFWTYLKSLFWWIVDSFYTPIKWALDGFFSVISSIFYFMFDGFLTAVAGVFNAFDLSSMLFTSVGDALDLPDSAIWLITQLGLPQCVTMVVSALGIRMLLNLLPASVTRI